MSRSPLDTLPGEVHLTILSHLPDVATLHNFISASPNAYTQYCRFPGTVLCAILRKLPIDVAELALRICAIDCHPTAAKLLRSRASAKLLHAGDIAQAIEHFNPFFAAHPIPLLRSLADTAREIQGLTQWCQQRQEEECAGVFKLWPADAAGPTPQSAGGHSQRSRPAAAAIARALWQLSLYVAHMQHERRHNDVFGRWPPAGTAREQRHREQAVLRACGYDFDGLPLAELMMVLDVLGTLRAGGVGGGRLVRALRCEDGEAAEWVPDAWETIGAGGWLGAAWRGFMDAAF
ncbi:hypothetical protein LTR36_010137 [Oleoguttula mirabilis]|uniref:F-box domain-containing protein n=1 Tax=Oleoguttula mirabilis TaxID=1507867 RepID=A0AAV9JT81_9PEZI|nr:hypothetical protein LTR36_010137 [Oleoguttula mirabilis]